MLRGRIGIAAGLAALALPTLASAQQPGAAGGVSAARCDLGCVQTNIERAVQQCIPRVEAEAPGDYEWLYRPIGGVFKQAELPEEVGSPVARYRGDNVRFMNSQGAWVRVMYECGFDTTAGRVAYMRVQLGVLGKKSAIPAAVPPQASRAVHGRPASQANASAAPGAPAPAALNVRLIGEPSDVDVRQIRPGTRPPAALGAPPPS